MKKKLTYKQAGVDIGKANRLVRDIKKLTNATRIKGSVGSIGGFGGFFDLSSSGAKGSLLVASTDGVGTKLKIAQDTGVNIVACTGFYDEVAWPDFVFDMSIKDMVAHIARDAAEGFEGTNMKKFREAQNPTNVAISLLGEPLLYGKISDLIEEFHKMGIITFLVTNSQHPEKLEGMAEPKQLYISVDAPDSDTYLKLDRPRNKDYWERLLKSLDLMNTFSCRKVLRLTMVKGWNMKDPKGYAKLIERANPDYVEVKAFMHIGEAMKRLPREAMPRHHEVKNFAEQVSEESGYGIKDEQAASRVVLLSRK